MYFYLRLKYLPSLAEDQSASATDSIELELDAELDDLGLYSKLYGVSFKCCQEKKKIRCS